MTDALDPDHLATWTGKTQTATDTLHIGAARRMQALLSVTPDLAAGAPLPHLWHWLYFTPETRSDGLGPDGHPTRGDFLPPVPLPRRMWAGGRFTFHQPLRLGSRATRHSTIQSVTVKQGRSGTLAFVTVRHELIQEDTLALTEDHDIVYRAAPTPGAGTAPAPPAAPTTAPISETMIPTMPILFRYSALTFNSHRIHYDQDYCRQVEGYPGCIVHGPLVATLLVGLATRSAPAALTGFEFRATAPAFHDHPLTLNAQLGPTQLSLWANSQSRQAMRATATFA